MVWGFRVSGFRGLGFQGSAQKFLDCQCRSATVLWLSGLAGVVMSSLSSS